MNKTDYLIVGGSAAGTTAAEVIRGLKPDASITIVTDEPHEQYSRVLLPHYTRKKIQREQVFLKKPEWYVQKSIGLLKGNRVKSLENSKKLVTLESGEEIAYGKLLIAIGGDVVRLSVPGADLGNVLYLRTIEDGDATIKYATGAKKALVVGGGFISLDFATSFKANGVEDIKILVREPFFWSGKLDRVSSEIIVDILNKNGVEVIIGEEVDHFEAKNDSIALLQNDDRKDSGRARMTVGAAVTKSGKNFDCDVVGVGIGIRSDVAWLNGSGIKIESGIVTNEFMQTNLEDIYAAGDCAQFHDLTFDTSHTLGNWANATGQGKIAGENMAKDEKLAYETASSYSDSFFEGHYSFIGVTLEDFADEVIGRGSKEAGKMTRIFIKTLQGVTRIVGASVINNPVEIGPLTGAVKGKVDISAHMEKLKDPNFDLKELQL